MGFLPETLFGVDVDYLFAYPTIKYVNIQDARLGIFKYFLTLGIVVYIGIYVIWNQGGYLEETSVTGTVRFTLQQPTQNSCDPTDVGCKNEFTPLTESPYCNQSTLHYTGNKFPCQFYENIGAQVVMDSAMLVMTRLTQYTEELVCNATESDTCPFLYNQTKPAETTYVSSAGEFTVLIDHSVRSAVDSDLQGDSGSLKGKLYVEKNDHLCKTSHHAKDALAGGDMTDKAPCYIKPSETGRGLDYFTLETLMQAADKDLDKLNYGGETFRETGATMIITITYNNFYGFSGKGDIQYYYTPSIISGSSYKYYSTEYSNYREERSLLNKHGIFMEAVQGGSLRRFDFNTLLIQLTTSLTLLAMSTVIVDFLAIYVLPDKEKYENAKYEYTEDFSEMRDREEEERAHQGEETHETGSGDLSLQDDLQESLLPSEEQKTTGSELA